MRKVLPISLLLTVALLGCSLNRTPGDGQPVTATPSMSPAATPGTSYGNQPMTSSRAANAAQIMREHQLYQPRFLGYLNPVPRAQSAAQQPADPNLYLSPAQIANPQLTVNSSNSSGPYPVVTGGTTEVATATTSAVTAASSVAGATISPNVASSALPSIASASGTTVATAPSTTTQLTVPASTANLPLAVSTRPGGQIMISNVKR